MYEIVFRDTHEGMAVPQYNEYLCFMSHGSKVFGRVRVPARKDDDALCPVVILFHGHPGGDRMADMAHFLREVGYATISFSYRGLWGSHGYYCMSHNIEDAFSVTEWVRENAERLHFDPERIYLFGHSMGGFSVLNAVADGLKVRGVIVMAPCNLGYTYLYNQEEFLDLMECKSNGYFNLPSDDYMEQDAAKNAEKWHFPNLVPRLDKSIPYRIIGAAKDATTPPKAHVYPMYEKMVENGYDVEYIELNDGHMFPESRVQLACRVIQYLNRMEEQHGN